jgi:hypothetical protein
MIKQKHTPIDNLIGWKYARSFLGELYECEYLADTWPERLGVDDIAALQAVGEHHPVFEAWSTCLRKAAANGELVTFKEFWWLSSEEPSEYWTRKKQRKILIPPCHKPKGDVILFFGGGALERDTASSQEFADYLNKNNKQPSKYIAAWFSAHGVDVEPEPRLDEYLSAMGEIEIDEADFKYGVVQAKALKTGNKCTPDDWKHWLDFRQWTPEQAVCLLYEISPGTLELQKYPDTMTMLLQLAEFSGNMPPYQWRQFGLKQGIPLPQQILDIQESVGHQPEQEGAKGKKKGKNIFQKRLDALTEWLASLDYALEDEIIMLPKHYTLEYVYTELGKKYPSLFANIEIGSFDSHFWGKQKIVELMRGNKSTIL